MRLISGIPAWTQMYFERLLVRTGKRTVRDVFPYFSLFVYGGVNYAPYRDRMRTRVKAWEDGAWVREAAVVHAQKCAERAAAKAA